MDEEYFQSIKNIILDREKPVHKSLMEVTDYHFIKKLEFPEYEIPESVIRERNELRMRWIGFETKVKNAMSIAELENIIY